MSSIKDDLLNNPITYGLISGLVIIVINLSIASIAEGSLEKGYQSLFRINNVFIYLVPLAVSVQMGLFKYHRNITGEKNTYGYEILGLTGSLICLLAMLAGYLLDISSFFSSIGFNFFISLFLKSIIVVGLLANIAGSIYIYRVTLNTYISKEILKGRLDTHREGEERLEEETERKNIENEEKNLKKQIEDNKRTYQPESPLFPPYFIGARAIGYSHIKKNIPCQDAFEYAKLPFNCGIIAVADGLGSALKSEIGAKTMVESGVRKTRELLKTSSNKEFNLKYVAMEAMKFAREEIISKSISEGCKPNDLACTAMIVVFDKDEVVVAHIGDGAVVAKRNNELLLLSEPVNSEYINEVTPITSERWKESVRCSPEISGIDCIAVFTDGCNHAAFRKTPSGIIPHEGFFMPLFSYAQKINDIVQGENQINSLLTSEKFSEYSDDDKTLVVSVLKKEGR